MKMIIESKVLLSGFKKSTLFEVAGMIVGKEEQDTIGIIVSRHIGDSFMRITYGGIGRRFWLVK
jgi:hypothetical protein